MKKFLITGATNGIGKETAKQVILKNYHLIIVARNINLIKSTIEELKSINKNAVISYYVVDFSNFNQVYEVANVIKKEHEIIDYAYLNAGAVPNKVGEVIDFDINKAMAVNYLGPRLFLDIIIDSIKKSETKMVLQTISMSVPKKYNHEDLVVINKLSKMKAYGLSKLFFQIYYYKLHIMHKEINFKLIDPLIVYSNATINFMPKGLRFLAPLMRLISRLPIKVANEVMQLIERKDKEYINVYKKNRIQNPHPLSFDKTMYRIINDYYKKQLGHYKQTIILTPKKAENKNDTHQTLK